MSLFGCSCKSRCTLAAIVVSLIVGVVSAFLLITGTITITPVFLLVAFGIAVAALGVLVVSMSLVRRDALGNCVCNALELVLTGALGTILFAVILLAVGIVATSVVSAILLGLTAGFFALTITATACLIRCLADCGA